MNQRVALGTLLLALAACSSRVDSSQRSSPTPAPPSRSAASSPSTLSSSTIASASPSLLATVPRITWSEVAFDGFIADIAADDGRFVAIGAGDAGAAAWTSGDGTSWEEHDVPKQSIGFFNDSEVIAGMRTLARLGDTLYAFGATSTIMDFVQGAGWRWTDGQAWEAIQSTSGFFAGEVIAVTASDTALVASTISFGGPRGTLSTWRWTSSSSWVQTSLSSDLAVRALTWADGTFLSAGSSIEGARVSLWRSEDGLDWTEVEAPDGASDVCALAPMAAGGFLAFGWEGDRIAAWTSTDGTAWAQSDVAPGDDPTDASGAAPPPHGCKVVAVTHGLVAGVTASDATLIWTSRDGAAWEYAGKLEVTGSSAPFGYRVPLAAIGDRVVLAGGHRAASDAGPRPALYVGVVEPSR